MRKAKGDKTLQRIAKRKKEEAEPMRDPAFGKPAEIRELKWWEGFVLLCCKTHTSSDTTRGVTTTHYYKMLRGKRYVFKETVRRAS